jgi:ribosomal protein L11 methyltransferase
MMRWAAISLECAPEGEEPVASILVGIGCGGAAVEPVSQGGPVEWPGRLRVTGYLPVDDRLEDRLSALSTGLEKARGCGLPVGSGSVTVRWVEEEDWAHAWKQFFHPLRVGRHFVIRPTWEPYDPAPGDRILAIDPGMAFGTGAHPTTQLCLELIEDGVAPGESVLDVGTGSGILAIAASTLGCSPIIGVDLDPVAIEAARANLRSNPFAAEVLLTVGTVESIRGSYHWIFANLIADVIRDDAARLASRLSRRGALLASGIIEARSEDVRIALRRAGLAVEQERRRDGWIAFVARRQ